MSETEPFLEDVETFCCKRRGQVLISLRVFGQPKGNVITGVPDSCNYESGCSKGAMCLLNANRITTGRKRK
jgi:hypothetical protein